MLQEHSVDHVPDCNIYSLIEVLRKLSKLNEFILSSLFETDCILVQFNNPVFGLGEL